jgi:hypothetical protein
MFLCLVGILVLPSSRTARGNRTLQASSDPWLLGRAAGGPPGQHQRDLRPRVFKFIVGRGQFLSCRRCRRACRGRLEPSGLSWQAPLLDIWHGEPQHLLPNAGGPPSERMIVRCRLERWLKEVNASNAAASGDCKTPNRCSAAEIRLRWRANVNQPSMHRRGRCTPTRGGSRRVLWWRVLLQPLVNMAFSSKESICHILPNHQLPYRTCTLLPRRAR